MLLGAIVLTAVVVWLCSGWFGKQFAEAWLSLVQRPIGGLLRARPRDFRENAANIAIVLAPLLVLSLLLVYAINYGGNHIDRAASLIAHSLGSRYRLATAGAVAADPAGTASIARDDTPAQQDLSHSAGRRSRPAEAGALGGGITGNIDPLLWSPATPDRQAVPQQTACRSQIGCIAKASSALAWTECRPQIESAAPPAHRWAFALADIRFNGFSSENPGSPVITYVGNGLLIRGPAGTWQRQAYSCAFDTEAGKVVSVGLGPLVQSLAGG